MDQKLHEAMLIVLIGVGLLIVEGSMLIFFNAVRQLYANFSWVLMAVFAIPIALIVIGVLRTVEFFTQNREQDILVYRTGSVILLAYWLIQNIPTKFTPEISSGWVLVTGVILAWRSFSLNKMKSENTTS